MELSNIDNINFFITEFLQNISVSATYALEDDTFVKKQYKFDLLLSLVECANKYNSSLSLNCFYVLGQMYYNLGRYKDAIKCLLDYRRVSTDDRYKCALTDNLLGACYTRTNCYDEAIYYYKEAFNFFEDNKDYSCLSLMHNNLGAAFYSNGRYEDSLLEHTAAINCLEKNNNYNNDDYYNYSINKARVLVKKKLYKEAISIINDVKSAYQNKQISIVTYYNSLSIEEELYIEMKDYKQAQKISNDILKYEIEFYGDNHPDTAIAYADCGNINRCLREYTSAEDNYNIALDILKKNYDENHPQIIELYCNMGFLYYKTNRTELAEEMLVKVVDVNDGSNFKIKECRAIAYSYLSNIYVLYGKAKYSKAIECLKKSKKIFNSIKGTNYDVNLIDENILYLENQFRTV